MKALVPILTSYHVELLRRCYMSIKGQNKVKFEYDVMIVVNTLKENYLDEVREEFKNEIEKRLWVLREEVQDEYFRVTRIVRDSLEAIPARVAGRCVEKNQHEIEQLLTKEIKKTLINLVGSIDASL